MRTSELLTDAIDRVREQVPGLVEGLDEDDLAWRPDPESNSIAWLLWHLTRIEDDHVAEVAGTGQAWLDEGWMARFELPLPAEDHGFGHSSEQMAAVRASGELLAGYHAAVAERASSYLATLTDADLDRVVDERWDPPVTLGVRLVSVVCEVNQHVGQAAYVRGLLERR
ncbi:MAG TPA: DUF664 domain-containing protein [Nocardioides sp.]|jgi:uncharacterized damage-inducible protein DinB|nr:DUF664 domain-containing protein [Nocardioides sp.]